MLILLWLPFLCIAAASALSSNFVFKSSIAVPPGWRLLYVAPPEHRFELAFSLRPGRFDELERRLYENSDPRNPRWTRQGRLSKHDVNVLVSPRSESISGVMDYLRRYDVDLGSIRWASDAKDWFSILVTISEAERLLGTKYFVYEHQSSGRKVMRTPSYQLPEDLLHHVVSVQPTNYFGNIKPYRSTVRPHFGAIPPKFPVTIAAEPIPVTLDTIKTQYNIGDYAPKNLSNNVIGITGYLEQYANLGDLKLFYETYLPAAANVSTLKVELVKGGINPQNVSLAGSEANLDVQYAGGLSFPIRNIFYSTHGRGLHTPENVSNTNEPYDVFLNYLLSKSDGELPTVLSTSYGEDERFVPEDYAYSVCNLYARLAARGVTIIHSSGDSGVGTGIDPTGSGPCFTPVNAFSPTFPATCPYVTSVGGTVGDPETAISFSGGGFSNYFPRPSYQDVAIPGYIANYATEQKGLFNTSGRGFPDVSALSVYYTVIVGRAPAQISGTSASAPSFAAIISLLNDVLISNGRKSLGFINPLLYHLGGKGFNDITVGNNLGCGTEGFNATQGWDPVTGWGSPDFSKLKDLILSEAYTTSSTSSRSTPTLSSTRTGGAITIFPGTWGILFVPAAQVALMTLGLRF
ncbi:tripeptidyl peptidase A [Cantharellus anzutake]|uniref:tripeptidyl peptidase A n=1 Tax=Cantharellus anzutake TaxID=1750568 RepID=UPI001902E8B7|nr:tripeptidyl peptidase A [Cantharellus anzutake]KAF8340259.1 tripeptidyl peptidase A [Cantharellus anzutake]